MHAFIITSMTDGSNIKTVDPAEFGEIAKFVATKG
jgi:hypothetical protein